MGHKHQTVNRESGRSMVEMMGTLAIMGVLSIGAIAGFNYAMNKHRSNEILDEARKRAYTVMTQIQLGLRQSLSDYDQHNAFAGGTFGSNIETTGLTGQFGISVTGVLGRVCNNLKDTVSEKTIIRKIRVNGTDGGDCKSEGNTLVLVYNNDMSQTDPIPAKACSGQGWLNEASGTCTCRPGYSGDKCQTASCAAGQMYCGLNGSTPICCEAGSVCTTAGDKVSGTCFKDTSATGCTTNDDCKSAEKCSAGAGKCYCTLEGSKSDTEEDCVSSITSGSCQPIGESDSTTVTGIGTVVKSDDKMNWWSARNWCEAQGMRLLDITGNRLGCSDPTIGTSTTGYCCKSGTSCNDKEQQSQAMQDLRDKWSSRYGWTATDRGTGHSCRAFNISLSSGLISLGVRSSHIIYHALCEE